MSCRSCTIRLLRAFRLETPEALGSAAAAGTSIARSNMPAIQRVLSTCGGGQMGARRGSGGGQEAVRWAPGAGVEGVWRGFIGQV
eukprot:5980038-Pyramimonas_sp.AAC.1